MTAIAEERKAIGFAVHADNDKTARKRLDQLNADDAAMAGELQSLEAAIVEARGRLAQAQQAEAVEAAKVNAKAIREALAEFVECGISLDEALAALGDEGHAMRAAVAKLRALGVTFPNDQQIFVLGLKAIQTALMGTVWAKEFPHLAPHDRYTWTVLIDQWAANIENHYVAPHLGEQTKEQQNEQAA